MSEKERNDELHATITRKIAQVEEQEETLRREERQQMEQLERTVQELKREEAKYTDIFQQLHSLGDEDAQKMSDFLQAVTRDVRNSCQSQQQTLVQHYRSLKLMTVKRCSESEGKCHGKICSSRFASAGFKYENHNSTSTGIDHKVKSRQSTFGSVSGWQTTFRSCVYRW